MKANIAALVFLATTAVAVPLSTTDVYTLAHTVHPYLTTTTVVLPTGTAYPKTTYALEISSEPRHPMLPVEPTTTTRTLSTLGVETAKPTESQTHAIFDQAAAGEGPPGLVTACVMPHGCRDDSKGKKAPPPPPTWIKSPYPTGAPPPISTTVTLPTGPIQITAVPSFLPPFLPPPHV